MLNIRSTLVLGLALLFFLPTSLSAAIAPYQYGNITARAGAAGAESSRSAKLTGQTPESFLVGWSYARADGHGEVLIVKQESATEFLGVDLVDEEGPQTYFKVGGNGKDLPIKYGIPLQKKWKSTQLKLPTTGCYLSPEFLNSVIVNNPPRSSPPPRTKPEEQEDVAYTAKNAAKIYIEGWSYMRGPTNVLLCKITPKGFLVTKLVDEDQKGLLRVSNMLNKFKWIDIQRMERVGESELKLPTTGYSIAINKKRTFDDNLKYVMAKKKLKEGKKLKTK